MKSQLKIEKKQSPLYVDLDGTLVRTNTFCEGLLRLLKKNPWALLKIFFWFTKGPRFVRSKIFSSIDYKLENLPYNEEFLAFLKNEHTSGRQIILLTGADERIAQKIAENLGIFSFVYASQEFMPTLIGKRKLGVIRSLETPSFGARQAEFAYAGNDFTDIPIFLRASECYLVNPRKGLSGLMQKQMNSITVFDPRPQFVEYVRLILKEIRLHQWIKNGLLFLPIFMAHRFTDFDNIASLLVGFISFGLCSSGVYVLNDLFDLDLDRQHPDKKHRPFASGDLPIEEGFLFAPFLIISGFLLGWQVGVLFFWLLVGYFFLTTLYTLKLKELLLIDVIMLAMLYNWRIICGGVIAHVDISPWLFAFTCFFFYSFALLKRASELALSKPSAPGRAYIQNDFAFISMIGSQSGLIAVVILALYINSPQVTQFYSKPGFLWFVCVILLYWVSRMWILTSRREMGSDPIQFMLKDKASYCVGFMILGIILAAI